MDRRAFIGSLGLLAVPLAAAAEQPEKEGALAAAMRPLIASLLILCSLMAPSLTFAQGRQLPTVGILTITGSPSAEAFIHGLAELGYVDGKNIRIHRVSGPLDAPDRLRAAAVELVKLKVDAIFAPATLNVTLRGMRRRPSPSCSPGWQTQSVRGSWRASPGRAATLPALVRSTWSWAPSASSCSRKRSPD